jgi:hypothetical protein
MNKSFYVVIPYNPAGAKKEKFLDKIKLALKPKKTIQKLPAEKFQEYKDQLTQRINHITNGLSQMEIKATPLKTNQLIRLFYELYNPGRS